MTLAHTLYRIPRQTGLQLLHERAAGHGQWLTGWRLILEPGTRARHSSALEETVIVLHEGTGRFEAPGISADVSRASVFADRATALYLPPKTELSVTASTRLEAILVSAPPANHGEARPNARPALVRPGDVQVKPRGRDDYARDVHDIFVDDPFASRLMVGETFNPPGHWSSYPPHKHDGGDGEPRLEEVYHFRIDPPHGFAHQELYTSAGEVAVHRVQDGDAVLLPYGYHPVSAPPGYRLYYLWALAGDSRVLQPYEDPRHRWIHNRDQR